MKTYLNFLFILGLITFPVFGNQLKEIKLDTKIFSKLDTFESVNLEEADQLFIKKDYKGAFAGYKAFTFEFNKSPALAYSLFRMGRCLHLLDKRNAAIKAYQNVVDYFPDNVTFAAAAMYLQGLCHQQNGDKAKCIATWAKLVKDKDYVNQPFSGGALEYLAKEMDKRKKYAEAVDYRWRTAVNFRKSNPVAADAAGRAVMYYYVDKKNIKKLKEFFTEASGVGFTHIKWGTIYWREKQHGDPNKPDESMHFWNTLMNAAARKHTIKEKKENQKDVVKYFVELCRNKFPENEDYILNIYAKMMVYEEDGREKWKQRVDKLFTAKPIDLKRIKKWIDIYGYDYKVRSAFFTKQLNTINASLKTFKDKMAFAHYLGGRRMHPESAQMLKAIKTDKLSDAEIASLAHSLSRHVEEEHFLNYVGRIKDKTLASYTRYQYYSARAGHRGGAAADKALVEIKTLKKSPKYAQGVIWREGELLYYSTRYQEAIKSFRAANRQPDSTWWVIRCQIAMESYDQAIKSSKGLLIVGGATAVRASMQIADIHKLSGNKKKEIEQLRIILKRYPKTRESSTAHQRLEKYGVKLSGGVSKADD